MSKLLIWALCLHSVLAAWTPRKWEMSRTSVLLNRLAKRTLGVPLENSLMTQQYLVNVTVGTPPQPFSLQIDTGSTDVWVPQPNSSGCAPACPPFSFDTAASSTYEPTGILFNATYGLTPDLQVVGEYFHDTLTIGDAVIPHMPANYRGLLGLGSRYDEAIFQNPASPYFGNQSATFPTLYDELEAHGYTTSRAFSLFLNDEHAKTGTVIFGGVDVSKYRGPLLPTPVATGTTGGIFRSWTVALTSVTRTSSNGNRTTILPEESLSNVSVVVDSGAPSMYIPVALAAAIGSILNVTTVDSLPYVPCSAAQTHRHDFLTFGFASGSTLSPGPDISIPYPALIYPFGYPANPGNVTAADGTQLCYFSVIPTEGNIALLGDSFQREAYLVFDPDNLQIAMAPVILDCGGDGSDEQGNVIPIVKGQAYPIGSG